MTRELPQIGVLVTAVGCATTGEQILRALQAGRRRYRLTAANTDPRGLIVAPGVDKVVLPPASHPEYLSELAEAARRANAQFIFPGCEPELVCLADRKDELARLTSATVVMNNPETIRMCLDKKVTVRAVAAAGLAVPRDATFSSVGGAVDAVEGGALRYPVVIKPRQGAGGSQNVHIAQNERELRFFAAYGLNLADELLLQEYVGRADEEYSVSVVHYPDGAFAGSAALRRRLGSPLSTKLLIPNHTPREELGPWLAISTGFSQGELGDFPKVAVQAQQVAKQLGSTGPLNIQGRLTDAGFAVFEVNPRFSGSTGLRARAGHNAPEALIDWYLGVPSPLNTIPSCSFVRSLVDHLECVS